MYVCFYEGWCTAEDIESTLKDIERLVNEVAKKVNKS